MNFQAGAMSGKAGAGNVMDSWSFNSAYKSIKDIDPKSITVVEASVLPSMDAMDIGLGSSEKGNAIATPKPRKKTMTSIYLKYFETAPDGKTRRCKFCGQSYSMATATGNLGRHLANRHPGYDKTGDFVGNTTSEPVTIAKKPPPQAKSPQLELDHLNWLLVKWLISASLPPQYVEEKWLVNSLKFISPSIQLWSGEKFQTVLREIFRSMREDLRVILDQISSKISIALEFWTSYEQILYMNVTCQWIDENWLFQKVLLDVSRIPCPCGGPEIYHALVKVLKLYNIENRVLSCTHDNSSVAEHACRTLKDDMDNQKINHFCYLPCAAHAMNSIVSDGLRSTKLILSKLREFVLLTNASSEISEDFIHFCLAYQEGNWKIPLDASPRWSGNYQMLDIARKAVKSMETVVRKYDEELGSRLLLSAAEKNAVNMMHAYLEPFYKTINNICTNKMLTIGLVLFFMDHISEMISTCIESRHSPDWLKSAAEDMSTHARSYNDQVCNVFIYMAAILDPRIKVELIPESLNSDNYLEEARNYFIRNYCTSPYSSLAASSYVAQEQSEDDGGGNVCFAEEIARKKRRGSMASATDELTRYLTEPPAPMPTDVLEWWKVNGTCYPRLSLMARDFLAVQATAVAPEELFSGKGVEIDRQRFATPHQTAQPMLCVKSWIEGGFKLKYKSTEIDYERLMELAAAASPTPTHNNPSTVSARKHK